MRRFYLLFAIFISTFFHLYARDPITYIGPVIHWNRVTPYLFGRPSPFNGFFLSGGIGADFVRWNGREVYLGTNPYPPIVSVFKSGAAFEGEFKIGFSTVLKSNATLGLSVGYHGYANDKRTLLTGIDTTDPSRDEFVTLRKQAGLFADFTPGIFFCRCWLIQAILGAECDRIRLTGFNPHLFRDQGRWGWSLRAGAGVRRAVNARFAVGIDYVHLFPGNAVWEGPIQQFLYGDNNRRIVQASSNQLIFSLSYYLR
jgi:hypothetical protein